MKELMVILLCKRRSRCSTVPTWNAKIRQSAGWKKSVENAQDGTPSKVL